MPGFGNRTNTGGGAGVPDMSVRVYQSAATTLTANTWGAIAFAAENFDTDTMHDNATNNSRITFTTAGKYFVGGSMTLLANAAAGTRILLGGATVLATQKQGNSGNPESAGVSTIYEFTAGQYVELQGFSGIGADTSGDANTSFFAYRIA